MRYERVCYAMQCVRCKNYFIMYLYSYVYRRDNRWNDLKFFLFVVFSSIFCFSLHRNYLEICKTSDTPYNINIFIWEMSFLSTSPAYPVPWPYLDTLYCNGSESNGNLITRYISSYHVPKHYALITDYLKTVNDWKNGPLAKCIKNMTL